MVTKRRTAAEIIATHLGWDMSEMSEYRYQRYTAPTVYAIGSHYYCAPSGNQKPSKDWKWEIVGTYHDRPVYRSLPYNSEDE